MFVFHLQSFSCPFTNFWKFNKRLPLPLPERLFSKSVATSRGSCASIVSASRSAKSTTNVDSLEPMCVVAFASLFYIFIFLPFYKLLVRRRCPLTQFNGTCKERFRFQRHVYRHQATCPAECQQSGKELVLAAKLICEHITVDKKAYVVM